MCKHILFIALICACGCSPSGFLITPVSSNRSLREIELLRDSRLTSNRIALIDVDGVIMNSAPRGLLSAGEHPVSLLVEKLDAAARDSRVKALVLRINSPGGSVAASEILHSEVMRFRERTGKPVLAMMMDVAASGGYYIACASNEIHALPSSVTGSIGVIMQTMDISGTLGKLGISTDAIKSGPRKDSGSPFRAMTAPERATFQSMIDEMYERFVDVVDQGRPKLSRQEVIKIADGRVYTASQAQQLGLVDHLGTLREVLVRAKKLSNIRSARVIAYDRPRAWHPNIYAQAPIDQRDGQAPVSLFEVGIPSWLKPGGARFMYLWLPK